MTATTPTKEKFAGLTAEEEGKSDNSASSPMQREGEREDA